MSWNPYCYCDTLDDNELDHNTFTCVQCRAVHTWWCEESILLAEEPFWHYWSNHCTTCFRSIWKDRIYDEIDRQLKHR